MLKAFNNLKLGQKILGGYFLIFLIVIIYSGYLYISVKDTIQTTRLVESTYQVNKALHDVLNSILDTQHELVSYISTGDKSFLKNYDENKKICGTILDTLNRTLNDQQLQAERLSNLIDINDKLWLLFDQKLSEDRKIADGDIKAYELQTGRLIVNANDLVRNMINSELKLLSKRTDAMNSAQSNMLLSNILGPAMVIILGLIIAAGIKKSTVTIIRDAINSLASTSSEMAATITEHDIIASQQAASVNETTSTMNEFEVSFSRTVDKINSYTPTASKAAEVAENGLATIKGTMNLMFELKHKVGSIAEQILKLSEQTSQISTVIVLVKDLADQTNLLALNAAVEAARAGEHGKGFAVVATEIRKLADQSKKSAEKISSIVNDIQKATNSTVMVTEEGTKNVDKSLLSAEKAENIFVEISDFARNSYEAATQTVLTVNQQSAAVKQVVDAMNIINNGVREIAAGLSQTREGVQRLTETAKNLEKLI